MVGLPDGEKKLRTCIIVYTQYRHMTDGQTSCHGIACATHTRRAVIITGPVSSNNDCRQQYLELIDVGSSYVVVNCSTKNIHGVLDDSCCVKQPAGWDLHIIN